MSETARPSLAAIVVSYDSAAWLPGCLRALLAADPPPSILVVDNASTDGSAALVARDFPGVAVLRSPRNLGYAGGANLGIRAALGAAAGQAETLVVLNPDVVVQPGALAALAAALAADPRAALAGGKLLYPDGRTLQHAGGYLQYPLALAGHFGYGQPDRGQWDRPREVEFVTGALLAIRRSALDELGGFDEGFYPGYFEEADLCRRARASGHRVLYAPEAVAVHHESVSFGRRTPRYYRAYHRGRVRFGLKHYSRTQLERDLAPAERAWLARVLSYVELSALRAAYADNLAALASRADFYANPAAVAPLPAGAAPVKVLRGLLAAADERLAARTGQAPGAAEPDDLTALAWQGDVVEPAFSSDAPGLGSLVAGVRRLWNWMSAKWYVRPMLRQQNEFNALAVAALRDLERRVRALEERAAAGGPPDRALGAELAAVQLRLRQLESSLASPSADDPTPR